MFKIKATPKNPLMKSMPPVFMLAIILFATPVWPDIDVVQSRYDLYRTGANTQETILNTSNVNARNFGLLFSYPVDGNIYAQPLYVSKLNVPGKGLRNLIYVATMKNVIYAFDADSAVGMDGGLVWARDFRPPSENVFPAPVPTVAGIHLNTLKNLGIESTPVIDKASKTLYLIARTLENNKFVQRLHALDLITGQEKANSPVTIAATYKGVEFNPDIQTQRAGLTLASNQVIIAWGSDQPERLFSAHGWVMAYDALSLMQTGVFATTTTVTGGGIWASGRAPAVIENSVGGQDIILFTGNAIKTSKKSGYNGVANFSESMLRLRIDPKNYSNTISLVDWFTPDNWALLDKKDLDLGGSGPVILPGSGYIVGGGKEGVMYVVDPEDMGAMQTGNPKLIQSFKAVNKLHIMGGAVVWDRLSIGKPLILYNWGESDRLKAFSFDGHKFDTNNVVAGKQFIRGHPGGILTLSANGASPGTGIVWSLGAALRPVKQGILRAYDAENVSRLLWSSKIDTPGKAMTFAKFTPPTVVNGKVYAPTFSNKLLVYGLLPK